MGVALLGQRGRVAEEEAAQPEVDVEVPVPEAVQQVLAVGLHYVDRAPVELGGAVAETTLRRGGSHHPTDQGGILAGEAVVGVAMERRYAQAIRARCAAHDSGDRALSDASSSAGRHIELADQPALDRGGLVGRLVVQHDVDVEALGD